MVKKKHFRKVVDSEGGFIYSSIGCLATSMLFFNVTPFGAGMSFAAGLGLLIAYFVTREVHWEEE